MARGGQGPILFRGRLANCLPSSFSLYYAVFFVFSPSVLSLSFILRIHRSFLIVFVSGQFRKNPRRVFATFVSSAVCCGFHFSQSGNKTEKLYSRDEAGPENGGESQCIQTRGRRLPVTLCQYPPLALFLSLPPCHKGEVILDGLSVQPQPSPPPLLHP